MRLFTIYILLLLSCVLPAHLYAQPSNLGNNELYLSSSVLSIDEFSGIGEDGLVSDYKSFPYTYSGATFLTYRHFFFNRIAVGVTAGMDNQKGDLSYGKYGVRGYNGENSGFYKREVYTGAIEALYTYRTEYNFKIYGYLGVGYTSAHTTYNFFGNIQQQDFFYGAPGSLLPKQNSTKDHSHPNFQFTPIGVRGGRDLAIFAELGFGYKGIFIAGLSYKMNGSKHRQPKLTLNPAEKTIVLPQSFSLDNYEDVYFLKKVKTDGVKRKIPPVFEARLADLEHRAQDKKGNVLVVRGISDRYMDEHYIMKGDVYVTQHYEALQQKVAEEKNRRDEGGGYAYVIIYRNNYNHTGSGKSRAKLSVNDSIPLSLPQGTAWSVKLTKEGNCNITTDDSEQLNLNVLYGHEYYIEAYVDLTGRWPRNMPLHLRRADNLKGELETGTFRHYYDVSDATKKPADRMKRRR